MDIPQDRDSVFIFGFCRGLNADHKVTQAEARAFIELLRNEPVLLDAEIITPHRTALMKLTKVEELWRTHCEQAENVVFSILGVSKREQVTESAPTLVFDTPNPKEIELAGAGVVFTGEFHMGRSHAEEVGMQLGALLQGAPSHDTQYVIVGSIPSPAWKFGKFGTKVARAIELKQRGAPIQIISEETFCAAVPAGVVDRAQSNVAPFQVEGFQVSRVRVSSSLPLSGMTVVITGTLATMSREEASEMVVVAGGKISGTVTTKTSYLVAGIDCGSKLDKARALGVPVIDEAGLVKLLTG